MKDISNNFGVNAGKIWNILNKKGPQTETSLLKNSRLNETDFYAAIGWLARENKICKTGARYKLGETNLTNTIGNNAGKVWNALYKKGQIDVSSIAKTTRIKTYDAYTALGWLAREDKVYSTGKPRNCNHPIFTLK